MDFIKLTSLLRSHIILCQNFSLNILELQLNHAKLNLHSMVTGLVLWQVKPSTYTCIVYKEGKGVVVAKELTSVHGCVQLLCGNGRQIQHLWVHKIMLQQIHLRSTKAILNWKSRRTVSPVFSSSPEEALLFLSLPQMSILLQGFHSQTLSQGGPT